MTANTTIAIGFYPSAKATNSIAIGNYAKIESNGSYGIAIGDHSKVQNGSYATALGSYAEAWGNYAIQIGYGINDTANTLKIGLSNSSSNNYTLLESDGTIPNARLKSDVPHKVSYTNPALTAVSGICTWTVTHTLGTTDFVATVFDTTTGKEVMFEGIHTDSTTYTINLTSSSDIASGAYKVVMIG